MKVLRSAALLSFLAGFSLLLVAVACGGGDENKEIAQVAESPTATATATATSTPTPVPPTPTPTPFNGAVSRFKIPKFGVDSKIENIGILPNNQLDTPHDPLATGWYEIYDKPGFMGNAVFSAHVDYFPNIIGPFNKLKNLAEGDEVSVVMENGLEYKYRVLTNTRYSVSNIPMGDLIWPKEKPAGKEWVTLITCGGEFRATSASGAGEYLHRDVVVAERIQ